MACSFSSRALAGRRGRNRKRQHLAKAEERNTSSCRRTVYHGDKEDTRVTGEERKAMIWHPKSQMQRDVLESDAMIVCAGGSAGTYKSETLLVDAVQEYQKPNFHGILFRESFPELSRALIPRAHALYSQMGAIYNSQ